MSSQRNSHDAATATGRSQPPQLSSSDLFQGGNLICIEHLGQRYWLRLTRGNKLILTK